MTNSGDNKPENRFEEFVKLAQRPDEEIGYGDRCLEIPCARCGGPLAFTGLNTMKTIAFVECQSECKHAYTVNVKL